MNKVDKNKKLISVKEDTIRKANAVFSQFEEFTDGVRCLFLIHRNKEGGDTNNTKVQKRVTRSSEEFKEVLTELLHEVSISPLPLRIYSSVNPRNFNKAIHKFKVEQLDADLYHQHQKENFYLDVNNRFIGCLMQPGQASGSLFLFDVDNEEGRDVMGETLNALHLVEKEVWDHKNLSDEARMSEPEIIVKTYPTKNGWHIVTRPFNWNLMVIPKGVELKKDALLLLSY